MCRRLLAAIAVTLIHTTFVSELYATEAFSLTPFEQEWLAERNYTISFTGDPNWLPFEAVDENGQHIGIVASFLREFSEDTGIQINYVATETWEESLQLATQRKVDVLSDVLGSVTIQDSHRFSVPYLSNHLIIMSNSIGGQINDLDDIIDHKVAVIRGYGYTWELFERYPNTNFVSVNNIQDGIRGLENGTFRFLVTTYALGQFQRAKLNKSYLQIRGQLPQETQLAFAVREDWPELRGIFDRWIRSLSPERRYQIAENWYLENTRYFATETINWRYVLWLTLFATFLAITALYIWLSRRTIKHQKQRFENALAAIKASEWKIPRQSANIELASTIKHILPSDIRLPSTIGDFIDVIDPSYQDQVYQALLLARSDGKPIDIEFRLSSDTLCWLALKGSALNQVSSRPTLIGTLENITERKQVEAQQQQQDALINLLFDAIPDLVTLDFLDYRPAITNKAYQQYFGQHSIHQHLPDDEYESWQQNEQTVLEHKRACHIATWLTSYSNHNAYFSIIRLPFVDQQQVVGVLSVARDITDTYLLQQELEQAKQQADQANASKSVFLANMSHEIRTPLNAVLGYAQILQQNNDISGESRQQIERIYLAGHRLLNLINEILDLSKIEAGRLQLQPEKVALKRELENLLSIHRQRAEEKGLVFKQKILLNERDHTEIDRTKFGQILLNALDNAVKFTEKGSISIKIEYRQNQLHIAVKDSGPGITQDELEQLFQPFSQGQSGTLNGGTGLGLVLSKRLAEAMGGDFSLNSLPGQGTEAHIRLPMILTSEQQAPDEQEHWRLPQNCDATALIIEDDELSRDMLDKLLSGIGFTTLCAENGEQALPLLQQSIDIIFSDIRMPKMDGVTLLQHIQAQTQLNHPPVVAVTASSFDHERRYYLSHGFSEFIPKPIALSQLYKVLRQFLPLEPSNNDTEVDKEPIALVASSTLDAEEYHALLKRFKQACLVGDADEALFLLNNLSQTDLSAHKLDIIKHSLEKYDFDAALSAIEPSD